MNYLWNVLYFRWFFVSLYFCSFFFWFSIYYWYGSAIERCNSVNVRQWPAADEIHLMNKVCEKEKSSGFWEQLRFGWERETKINIKLVEYLYSFAIPLLLLFFRFSFSINEIRSAHTDSMRREFSKENGARCDFSSLCYYFLKHTCRTANQWNIHESWKHWCEMTRSTLIAWQNHVERR